jgi:hypothetical protein
MGNVDPDDLDHWFREAVEKRLGPLPGLWRVTHGYRSLGSRARFMRSTKPEVRRPRRLDSAPQLRARD